MKQTRSKRVIKIPERFCDAETNGSTEVDFDHLDRLHNSSFTVAEDDVLLDVSVSEDDFQDDDNVLEPTLTQEFGGGNEEPVNMNTSATQRTVDMRNDPVFKEMLNQAVAEQMKLVKQKQMQDSGTDGPSKSSNDHDNCVNVMQTPTKTADQSKQRNVAKSSSDTTIYAPGLRLAGEAARNRNSPHKSMNELTINQITDFVERIRIETAGRQGEGESVNEVVNRSPIPGTSGVGRIKVSTPGGRDGNSSQDQARAIADEMILDAEQYHAAIEKPAGRLDIEVDKLIESDDQFFHITCHIDSALKVKIEQGEFVDLEKLLPKDPTRKAVDDNRMELVNRDGSTFFIPAVDKEAKISNVRKWEQAFRVYAAIYSRANPHRAAEIWQYVYTINLAASSFVWDNVANYDFTFRQLMAKYPSRSWALIYNQMWNLAMREPLHRFNVAGSAGNSARRSGEFNSKGRDNYCWRFNKNRCKFGTHCKWEHRCFYCDGHGHGVFNCSKKNRGKDKRGEKLEEFRQLDGERKK